MTTEIQPLSRTILVIDNDEADWQQICGLLDSDYVLSRVQGVNEAFRKAESGMPDCVLLSYGYTGPDALEELRQVVRRFPVVIVMSHETDESMAVDVLQSGARDFVVKCNLNRPMLTRIIMRELERYDLEKSLKTATENFYELADRVDQVLWLRSRDGSFLYLNPAFETIWGHSREQMTNDRWLEFVHQDDRARIYQELTDAVHSSKEFVLRYRIIRGDGKVRQIRDGLYPILDDRGHLVRFGGIASDITEEIQEQADQRLSQKMQAIGQLSAGIAHEVNTPTQYVNDNIEFLRGAMADLMPMLQSFAGLLNFAESAGMAREEVTTFRKMIADADFEYLLDEIPGALEQSRHGISQIKSIVLAMKEFSHPSEEMETIDLNRAIETAVTVTRNEWKYVASMSLDLDELLPSVSCIPSAINQVLLNMIMNAAHAIADNLTGQPGELGQISISTSMDGEFVQISIADTGIGIDAEHIERIYDPFFTTKEVGRGTGQGLAIVFRIVAERHDGSIDVESVPGKGTTFTIRLPCGTLADIKLAQGLLQAVVH